MANWMLVEDFDSKTGNLINLDLVPHVTRNADGSVAINISPTHTLTVNPGKSAENAWDFITRATLGKNPPKA